MTYFASLNFIKNIKNCFLLREIYIIIHPVYCKFYWTHFCHVNTNKVFGNCILRYMCVYSCVLYVLYGNFRSFSYHILNGQSNYFMRLNDFSRMENIQYPEKDCCFDNYEKHWKPVLMTIALFETKVDNISDFTHAPLSDGGCGI